MKGRDMTREDAERICKAAEPDAAERMLARAWALGGEDAE